MPSFTTVGGEVMRTGLDTGCSALVSSHNENHQNSAAWLGLFRWCVVRTLAKILHVLPCCRITRRSIA